MYKSQTHDIILGEVVELIHADELMDMEELEKDTSVDIFDRSTNNVRKPGVIKTNGHIGTIFPDSKQPGKKGGKK